MDNGQFFETSDGAHIYFEQYGREFSETILMVPGFLCTTKFFRRNVEVLAGRYHVVVMDPRGQGLSSKTLHGNTVKRGAQDIAELIEHLSLKKTVLLGWSLGSSVCLDYAVRVDEGRLAGLILVDGSLFPLSPEGWNKHRARNYNVQNWLDTYLPLYYDADRFYEAFISRISNGMMSREDRKWVEEECRKTLPWTALELHYDFCHTNNVPALERLECPVGFFGGSSKDYGLLMLEEYQKHVHVPSQIYPFYESGHLMFYYEAEKFNASVMSFCSEMACWHEKETTL